MQVDNLSWFPAANILDWNNCRRDSGEYSNVSKVCFSFSPTKELAAITEDAMMGTIRKKGGIMLFNISPNILCC